MCAAHTLSSVNNVQATLDIEYFFMRDHLRVVFLTCWIWFWFHLGPIISVEFVGHDPLKPNNHLNHHNYIPVCKCQKPTSSPVVRLGPLFCGSRDARYRHSFLRNIATIVLNVSTQLRWSFLTVDHFCQDQQYNKISTHIF